MKQYLIKAELTEPILGSQPTTDIATEFIHKKAIEAGADPENFDEEVESLPEALEKGTTVFHRKDGQPMLWDYQVKGFLKEWASILNATEEMGKTKNLKSKVDNLVYVTPRQIPLVLPEGEEMTYNERPLRAMTMQGPRVSLARSEQLPAGTTFEFRVTIVTADKDITGKHIKALLDMGSFKGLGQWRNGSWGRFTYTMEEVL